MTSTMDPDRVPTIEEALDGQVACPYGGTHAHAVLEVCAEPDELDPEAETTTVQVDVRLDPCPAVDS